MNIPREDQQDAQQWAEEETPMYPAGTSFCGACGAPDTEEHEPDCPDRHDLAGLEAALARQSLLLCALEDLCGYQKRYNATLTPTQQEFLKTAIHTTACLCNDEMGGV